MDLTKEELQALNSIYKKYESLCDSFPDCSECPMGFVEINRFEHYFEGGCFKDSLESVLRWYKRNHGEDSLN